VKTIDELMRLEQVLASTPLPRADREWGGADVVITSVAPRQSEADEFYPGPRYVITEHSRQLSWMFERLRDAFYAESRLDGCSKIEFFGRLANAANRCLHREPLASAELLCAAVLHEAFAIYDEMEEGTFECLAVAVGNEIVDDYVDEAMRSGFLSVEETLAFFASHGVEVGRE
jgi:hypothetical protein